MSTLQIYNARAAQCRLQAEASSLANVQDRCLRSAMAWEGMAEQVRITEAYRANEVARKAALAAVDS